MHGDPSTCWNMSSDDTRTMIEDLSTRRPCANDTDIGISGVTSQWNGRKYPRISDGLPTRAKGVPIAVSMQKGGEESWESASPAPEIKEHPSTRTATLSSI
nr:hypothetical protein Iba_chr13aCG7780 [Ipomoea batatas]